MEPEKDPSDFLEDASYRIVKIAIPVVLTLILDAVITRLIENTHGSVSLDRSFSETMSYNSGGLSTMWSILLAVILIVSIIIVTAILLVCYYYGYTKVIFVWMIIAVSVILSYYVWIFFHQVPPILNFPVDYIAICLLIMNLVVIGDMSIFWRAPKVVTQAFLVFISVLIALVFLSFPDWTIWILLGILVIYDCCVVLCPHGLLNMIIKKSEERNDEIPALIYASAAYIVKEDHSANEYEGWEDGLNDSENSENDDDNDEDNDEDTDGDGDGSGDGKKDDNPKEVTDNTDLSLNVSSTDPEDQNRVAQPVNNSTQNLDTDPQAQQQPQPGQPDQPQQQGEKKKKKKKRDRDGVRLGLGDFCFYGILITRAARLGWDLTILCIFAVILGLSITLLILAWVQRALPALPISLVLGIIFFCIGALTFRKFDLNLRQTMLAF